MNESSYRAYKPLRRLALSLAGAVVLLQVTCAWPNFATMPLYGGWYGPAVVEQPVYTYPWSGWGWGGYDSYGGGYYDAGYVDPGYYDPGYYYGY